MPTLLLRLQGPMQSWGTRSRFDYRDTSLEPTKSGVLGLLCAALGRDRKADIADLAALRMGVRVDRQGVLNCDYQTAKCVVSADGESRRDLQSWRYYLADAAFLVGLEGADKKLLVEAHRALKNPHWPLFLGRKGYMPSPPVYLPDGLRDEPLVEALAHYPYLPSPANGGESPAERLRYVRLRYVLEAPSGRLILDQPIAPFAERRFGPRHVVDVVAAFGEIPSVPF